MDKLVDVYDNWLNIQNDLINCMDEFYDIDDIFIYDNVECKIYDGILDGGMIELFTLKDTDYFSNSRRFIKVGITDFVNNGRLK